MICRLWTISSGFKGKLQREKERWEMQEKNCHVTLFARDFLHFLGPCGSKTEWQLGLGRTRRGTAATGTVKVKDRQSILLKTKSMLLQNPADDWRGGEDWAVRAEGAKHAPARIWYCWRQHHFQGFFHRASFIWWNHSSFCGQDLATMVHDQGEIVDSIEQNIESTTVQVLI